MNKIALTAIGLVLITIGYGQTTQITYYNNERLDKEVSQEKAKYSKTVTRDNDGVVITEIKDLKKEEIIRSDGYKGLEPYGIWRYWSTSGIKMMDYGFDLVYSSDQCNSTLKGTAAELFTDNSGMNYTAPKLESGQPVYSFIGRSIIYPNIAKEEGIQGVVFLNFLLTKDGTVQDIVVTKGVNSILDKEAVRVVRQLNFSEPPLLNGEPYGVCISMPITFQLN